MSRYTDAINQINSCLTKHNIISPIDGNMFQGIYIKKMSNSNLIKENKYTVLSTNKKTDQTHIDLPNKQVIKFFFDDNKQKYNAYEPVTLDIPIANLEYLKFINNTETYKKLNSHNKECLAYKRIIPFDPTFSCSNRGFLNGYIYKKRKGHRGKQSQLNRGRKRDAFYHLLTYIYENDYLIFLKYSSNKYMLVVIPSEISSNIQSIVKDNVNYIIHNEGYVAKTAQETISSLYKEIVESEFNEIESQLSNTGSLNGNEKEAIIKERVGQSFFRQQLLKRECKCAICNIKSASVLKASHIKRWVDSSPQERMDTENGLLLCANHDALFDRHLISFNPENGKIAISPAIDKSEYKSLELSTKLKIKMSQYMSVYMQDHYLKYEEKQDKSTK